MKISRAGKQGGQQQSRTGVGEELLMGYSQVEGVYCVNIFIIGYIIYIYIIKYYLHDHI